jgi:hypothetical protein
MKMPEVYKRFSLLLFMAIVAGCSSVAENSITPSLETPALSVGSVSPNETVVSTSIDEATSTALPQLTVFPTLSVEDAHKRLLDLLVTNGNCSLPCLWGLTSGESSYLEARVVLIPLSSIAETAYFGTSNPEDDISPLYVEGDLRLNARVLYLYGRDGVISLITFRLLEEKVVTDANGNWISKQPIFDSTTFIERIEYYSLFHVLNEQGLPSSVLIATSNLPDPVVAGGFDIALLYPEQGIWVNYTMPMYNHDNTKTGCPINAHVEISLTPSGNPKTFFSLLEKTDWGVTKNGYKLLEEVTSMSVTEFYETFRNSPDVCIDTPVELWPVP